MRGFCVQCYLVGYCRRLQARLVTDADLANPEFIRDLRHHAYGLGLTRDAWVSQLTDRYRDYQGTIIDADGADVLLDMEVFEHPGIRDWLRDFACTPCPADVTPRVRREAWERVRVMATILRAVAPEQAGLWGVRPANDHTPIWQADYSRTLQSRTNPPRGCPLGRMASKEVFDRKVASSSIIERKSPDEHVDSGAE